MTEQERRRRRRERERQMRMRTGNRRKEEGNGGLSAFRLYVTMILVGGCLLISLFHTDTSEMVCSRVKETIAVQIEIEKVEEWKERVLAFLQEKELSLPVFEEKKGEKKEYRPDTSP